MNETISYQPFQFALGNAIPPVMFWYVAKAVSGKLQENING